MTFDRLRPSSNDASDASRPTRIFARTRTVLTLAVAAGVAAMAPAEAFAKPCKTALDAVQAKVDARLDAVAAAGATAPQAPSAQLHQQPTPQSIAEAEAKLGEGAPSDKALAELADARAADAKGDEAGCMKSLAAARRDLGL